MKKLVLALLLLSATTFAQQNLACIDSAKLMSESQFVKQKQSLLTSKAQEYQKQLDEINKKLEDLKKQIESKAVSQQVKEQKIKEYQQVESKGFELQNKANRELAELKMQLERELFNNLRNISTNLAKQKGYTGILDCSAFLYIDPQLDITDEVMNRLDQMK